MIAIAGEFITGAAVGIEWVDKGEIDDSSYLVLELFCIRLVISFE